MDFIYFAIVSIPHIFSHEAVDMPDSLLCLAILQSGALWEQNTDTSCSTDAQYMQ